VELRVDERGDRGGNHVPLPPVMAVPELVVVLVPITSTDELPKE
jgi:hypothetical protein